jgi:Cof subfamily protein (haloacid dehalogenase superfamily)
VKYKLIAVDFDETLVINNSPISPANKIAIQKYLAAGGHLCIATGREYKSLTPRLDEIPEIKYLPSITFQGALIKIMDAKDDIYKQYIQVSSVERALNEYSKTDLEILIVSENHIFVPSKTRVLADRYMNFLGIGQIARYFDTVEEFSAKYPNPQVLKIMFLGSPAQIKSFTPKLNKIFKGEVVFTVVADYLSEGVQVNCSKGNALKILADYYGVDISETIGVGDSQNDISLVSRAGLGIGVNNMHLELLKYCDYFVPTNGDSQIAFIIDKVLAGEEFVNTNQERLDFLKQYLFKQHQQGEKINLFLNHISRMEKSDEENGYLADLIKQNLINQIGTQKLGQAKEFYGNISHFVGRKVSRYEKYLILAHICNIMFG